MKQVSAILLIVLPAFCLSGNLDGHSLFENQDGRSVEPDKSKAVTVARGRFVLEAYLDDPAEARKFIPITNPLRGVFGVAKLRYVGRDALPKGFSKKSIWVQWGPIMNVEVEDEFETIIFYQPERGDFLLGC